MPCMADGIGGGKVQEIWSFFGEIQKIRNHKISSFIYGLDQDTELLFYFFIALFLAGAPKVRWDGSVFIILYLVSFSNQRRKG